MTTVGAQEVRSRLIENGAVHVPRALDNEWLELVAQGIRRNRRVPGPHARVLYEGTDREMYVDYCNWQTIPEYQILLRDSPLSALVAATLGSDGLWLLFEQMWIKDAGTSRRTPWHQDLPVWLTSDGMVCGVWITLDPVPAAESLEFVLGSHRGPLYGGSKVDRGAETEPLYPEMGAIPDIEADRASYDIVSFPNEPGDVVIFHPAIIHGGGASSVPRRTLSLRFFGDDVVYEPPPGTPSPPFPGVAGTCVPGQPLRSSWFPQVYPVADFAGLGGWRP